MIIIILVSTGVAIVKFCVHRIITYSKLKKKKFNTDTLSWACNH